MVVVNKLDRERGSFDRALESIREAFGRTAIPLQLPIGSEQAYRGVIDLITMKAYTYTPDGDGRGAEIEIPAENNEAAEKAHEQLVEMIAEGKDELMEEFFEKGTLSAERIIEGLRDAVRERRLYPILCASALRNIGTDRILDFIVDSFPAPVETEPVSVIIPARALAELARISTDEEDITLVITPTRKQALFHAPNVDLVSQLIEGNFPDYQQIIPTSYTTRTVLNTNSFLRACKTANIFARDAANIVRLQIAPGGELAPGHITIAATSAELGDNVGEIDASIEGDAIEIAFNVKYLIDVLSVMDSAQVVLETTTSSSPGVIKPVGDVDFVHVIMPMHVRSD